MSSYLNDRGKNGELHKNCITYAQNSQLINNCVVIWHTLLAFITSLCLHGFQKRATWYESKINVKQQVNILFILLKVSITY